MLPDAARHQSTQKEPNKLPQNLIPRSLVLGQITSHAEKMLKTLTPLLFLAGHASAQPYLCGGVEPFWSLEIHAETATFSTPDIPSQTLEIPLITETQGRPWPRAFTLISNTATGIALIRERACNDTMSDRSYPFEIDYLTQTGTTPVILTGCCRLKP